MTYIFPYRVPSSQPSSSNAILATSASVAEFFTIPVQTVLTASAVTFAGVTGDQGGLPTCGSPIPGPSGSNGPPGDAGQSAICPPGSVECVGITPPTGYGVVCVEIPAGCTSGYVFCPPDIYTAPSFSTPPTPTPTPTRTATPTPTPTLTMTPTPSTPACYFHGGLQGGDPSNPSDCGNGTEYPTSVGDTYSDCLTLTTGCFLYTNSICTTELTTFTAVNDGGSYYEVITFTGEISNSGGCTT